MGTSYTKLPGTDNDNTTKDLLEGKAITIDGIKYELAEVMPANIKPQVNYSHFYKKNGTIFYLRPVKSGGGGVKRRSNARIAPQVVLYPEQGLQSRWSAPKKRTEKISVDGNAPVNFLTENIDM